MLAGRGGLAELLALVTRVATGEDPPNLNNSGTANILSCSANTRIRRLAYRRMPGLNPMAFNI